MYFLRIQSLLIFIYLEVFTKLWLFVDSTEMNCKEEAVELPTGK